MQKSLSHFVAIKFVLWRQLPQDIKSNKKVATAIEAFCGDIYDSGRTHSLSQKRERDLSRWSVCSCMSLLRAEDWAADLAQLAFVHVLAPYA